MRINALDFSIHHVQTSLGVSNQLYSNNNSPVHGYGQGKGSVGTDWEFISIPMIKVSEETTTGFTTTKQHNNKA